MRRRLTALLAMVVVTVMLVAAPAFADKGGFQHEGSCGVGRAAHEAIADPTSPGATEYARIHPSEVGCTTNEPDE
jgi:hypothetical protein